MLLYNVVGHENIICLFILFRCASLLKHKKMFLECFYCFLCQLN